MKAGEEFSRLRLSGIMSRKAAANMKPEPKAKKYFKYSRCQLVLMMISPPKRLAAAAQVPKRRLVIREDIKDWRLPVGNCRLREPMLLIRVRNARTLRPVLGVCWCCA